MQIFLSEKKIYICEKNTEMKKILLTISSLIAVLSSAQIWNTTGNNGTNPSTNFLGTIDAQPLIFRTNNSEKVRITLNGSVGVGTDNPTQKLDVNGSVIANERYNNGNDGSYYIKLNSNGYNIPIISYLENPDNTLFFGNPGGQYHSRTIIQGGNGDVIIEPHSTSGAFVVKAQSGNVGIGTIAPQAKLDVNGDVRITNIPASTSSSDQALVVDSQGFVKKGLATSVNLTLSEKQKVNARATGYAIIAGKNPGVDFSVFVIPWDGVNTLEYNANNQINPSWHPQVVIKGNFFNQGFDGSDFTTYSSFVTSQSDFDLYKSTGTQWWIVCSTLPSFSKSITSNENTGNVAITNKLEAKEIKVTLTPTADFVFEKEYGLPKLEEVEKFVIENKHLPEIASAKEMEKEGVNVGEFQIKLLQKIEELTLYSIDLNKKNKEQEDLIKSQADILKSLNERLEKLEKAKQK